MNQDRTNRKLAAIFSTDVVGYSRMMEADEAWTIQNLEENKQLMSSLIEDYKGRVVDAPGDNLLAEFGSVINAVECAVKIQKQLNKKNSRLTEEHQMHFRIGVNLGDVVEEDSKIYGNGVNIAARLESLAEPGGICISGTAYDQVKSKIDVDCDYLGEYEVKNINEPVRVYRILMGGESTEKYVPHEANKIVSPINISIAIIVLLVIALGTTIAVLYPKQSEPPHVVQPTARVEINLPPDVRLEKAFPLIAISPNGRHLVYTAIHNGISKIFVRSLDNYETMSLSGTEGAFFPFFSPDSAWIGFFAQGKLKKVPIGGGSVVSLCDAGHGGGAAWGSDGTIVFTDSLTSGLLRVSSNGGEPRVLTIPDRNRGENSHRLPQFLPGRQTLLFTAQTGGGGWDDFEIWVLRLDTGEKHRVRSGGHTGRFIPTGDSTGHLIYYREGDLWAVPFDPIGLKVIGDSPVPKAIVKDIMQSAAISAGDFSFSDTGLLAYVPASQRQLESSLVWVDREGNVEPVSGAPVRPYYSATTGVGVSVDPDGRRVAVQIVSDTTEIWILDLERETMSKFRSEIGSCSYPLWTPDGKSLVYTGYRKGLRNIYRKNADGTGEEERLTTGENHQYPMSFSPDGKYLIFGVTGPQTGDDIYTLQLDGNRIQKSFLNTKWGEFMGRLSNDGNWIAYSTNENGGPEVFVESFPERDYKKQISTEGGTYSRWAPSGHELFYRNGNKMMAVSFKTDPTFMPDKPRLLFEEQFGPGDVSPDGRFLMVQAVDPEKPVTKINIILNWFEDLKKKVPAD